MSFSLCSINVRGIRDALKRKAIFLYCKKYKVDFFYFQETHAAPEDFSYWKNQWGDDLWLSYGSNHSAGVAVLKGNFKGKILKNAIHAEGRWVLLVIEVHQNVFILSNIYGYNDSRRNIELFKDLEQEIISLSKIFPNANYILGGDWNSINDPQLDCSPPRAQGSYGEVNQLCTTLNCIDIWRIRNPTKMCFTWSNKNLSKQSRLDYWLISNDLVNQVTEACIEPAVLTDHKIISLHINVLNSSTNNNSGKGYWKLNNSLLKDEKLKLAIKKIIAENLNKAKMNKAFGSFWEYCKFQIRCSAIKRGQELAKERRVKEETILKEIVHLYAKPNLSYEENNTLHIMQLELDSLYEYKAKGAFVRSRQKWLEEGEKNTKYFFNLERRNNCLSSITKLKINNVICDDLKVISDFVTEFYSNLYSRSDIGQPNAFLANIQSNAKCLSESSKELCDEEININEIKSSIAKLKDNKAPGNDGLTAEFFKEFIDLTSEFLLAVYKEAFEKGFLPVSMTQGLISLIPKTNKDCLFLDNWRPITLINNDAKVLAHVFAQRLKKCLHEIIDECQSGFMKHRHISNNIRLVLDLIDYKDLLEDSPMICFIDYYKAFDTVDHGFLLTLLNFFGFGSKFIHAIHVMYTNCNSSIKLANGTSGRFSISRGIKQGDPAAPYLFLVIMQALCLHIHKDHFRGICIGENEIKCSQLADDTTIFLQNQGQTLKAIECLQTFSDVSGLQVNLKKCELFSLKEQYLEGTTLHGIPVKDSVTYLGIKICKDSHQRALENFEPLVNKVKNRFNIWLSRDLSIYGRILLSKGEGLSRLTYPAMALDVPKKIVKEIDKNLYNFIWRNRHHYLKKGVLCNSLKDGGLGMLDFGTSNIILKTKWIKNYFLNQDKLWNYIPDLIFRKVGGLKFLLKCNFHIPNLPLSLSSFHKQVLASWIDVYKYNFSPHKCFIWNNKFVKCGHKSLFISKWFEKDVVLIQQLLANYGTLYSYPELVNKYNLDISEKEYQRVCNAIPSGVLQLLQPLTDTDIDASNSYPMLEGLEIINKNCNNKHLRKAAQAKVPFIAKYRWNAIVRNINWNIVFIQSKKYCINNKSREVSFKIIHRIYPCKVLLEKMKKVTDNLCSFCKLTEESICHLFFECMYLRLFWYDVANIFNKVTRFKIILNKRDVLFLYEASTQNCDYKIIYLLNLFIIQAKYYVHKCKWAKKIPRIREFITEMDRYAEDIRGLDNTKAIKTTAFLTEIFRKPLISFMYPGTFTDISIG